MRKLKSYDSHKNTGLEWLKTVPTHWQIRPNRTIWNERKITSCVNERLLSVTIKQGLIPQSDLTASTAKRDSSNQDKSKYKLVKQNDIVYNKMRMWQGAVGVSKYQGIVSPAYIVLETNAAFNSKYYHYLLRTPYYIEESHRNSYGICDDQLSLRYVDFKCMYNIMPPKEEQDQIVRYLDSKLAKINKFIRNKKRLIELLKEQKQAVINQAVTKGLDPDAKMKPSGVEWLGGVPEDWEIKRIKRCITGAINGAWGDEPNLDDTSNNIICIRVADFDTTTLTVANKQLTIRNYNTDKTNNRILKHGDILLEKSGGGDKQPVGRVIMYTRTETAVCSNFISRLKVDTTVIGEDYLLYILHNLQALRLNMPYIKQTTGIQNLDENQYFNIPIPVPPRNIQKAIVQHVKQHFSVIDQTIERITKEIDLITEYRTSLISAVVTGKVDVRGIEVDEPPADDLAALEPAELEVDALQEEELMESEVG